VVLLNALAVAVALAQIEHGVGVASLGAEAQVVHRALKVDGHAEALVIGSTDLALRLSVALLCGLPEAAQRLGVVLLDALAVAVEDAEVVLRLSVAEVRCVLEPRHSSGFVLGKAQLSVIVGAPKLQNCLHLALLSIFDCARDLDLPYLVTRKQLARLSTQVFAACSFSRVTRSSFSAKRAFDVRTAEVDELLFG
jgi:hypothetical protein